MTFHPFGFRTGAGSIWLFHLPRFAALMICFATLGRVMGQGVTPGQPLEFEPAFTRVTQGPIVTDTGEAIAGAWADYDGDGDLDLFVTHNRQRQNALYRNDGGGAFTRVRDVPPVNNFGVHTGAGWGDFDNDGKPDLFVHDFTLGSRVFRNLGGGAFGEALVLRAADGAVTAMCGGWSDYDQDGRLDLLVSYGGGLDASHEQLWHQLPGGGFKAVTTGPVVSSAGFSMGAGWGDYDGDGRPDLFIANAWDEPGFLFHNLGGGRFERVTRSPFDTQQGGLDSIAWGDYDNDGDLDLFVAYGGKRSVLYRNDGDGNFSRRTDSVLMQTPALSNGAMWGDYDNDGWLDLYVANRGQRNFLYRNRGDGSFELVTKGPAVTDVKASNGCAWGDYDGDGFLDLFVANWDGQTSDLYHNRGNGNAWLRIRCQGTESNRSGIGAKVRVLADLDGGSIWQLREITSGDGWGGPELVAHFGLHRARVAQRVVVEWPSGLVQELTNVPAGQTLTLIETKVPPIQILPNGGLFTNRLEITLVSSLAGTHVRFTADGSEPVSESRLYAGPLTITNATVLRARAFYNGFPVTEIVEARFQRIYAFDNDGVPAAWREQYFGPDFRTDPRAAADADPDSDDTSNLQEYVAQTHPLDPLSGFKLQVRAVPEIRFPSVAGQKYRVLRRTILGGGETRAIAEVMAVGEATTYVDTEAGVVANPAFYLVEPIQ